jgi:hypothetical protein
MRRKVKTELEKYNRRLTGKQPRLNLPSGEDKSSTDPEV